MDHCPSCGADHDDAPGGCPACNGSEEVHRCTRCSERYSGARACPACGTLRAPVPCESHPDREAFGCCVVCGRAVCRACVASGSRVHLCEEHRGVRVIEGWAQVYSTARDFEAWLIRESLLAEGIDAQIYSQRDRTFSVDLGELSIVRLLVPVWEYESAREVVRSHLEAEEESPFACATCGEAMDPAAPQCRSCGAALARPGDD